MAISSNNWQSRATLTNSGALGDQLLGKSVKIDIRAHSRIGLCLHRRYTPDDQYSHCDTENPFPRHDASPYRPAPVAGRTVIPLIRFAFLPFPGRSARLAIHDPADVRRTVHQNKEEPSKRADVRLASDYNLYISIGEVKQENT